MIVFRGGGWNCTLDRFQAHVEGVNKETENNNAVVERYILKKKVFEDVHNEVQNQKNFIYGVYI